MRFVIYGAGSVGGVVGARLFQHGHEVMLIARGAHLDAIRERGLRVEDPVGGTTVPIAAAAHPAEITWRPGDVCLLAVKSQHTTSVLGELARVAPESLPVVCLQNGVRNEPEALRRFPSRLRRSGHVPDAPSRARRGGGLFRAVTGILDVGRYPAGVDGTATAIAAAFAASGFDSHAIADVARWKWRKLVTNLGNAVEAVCGPAARRGSVGARAAAEGEACLSAAGIDAATADEDRQRRADLLRLQPVAGRTRAGGSSWQSLARTSGGVETDDLNGEIVLLGRLHGVPTPPEPERRVRRSGRDSRRLHDHSGGHVARHVPRRADVPRAARLLHSRAAASAPR